MSRPALSRLNSDRMVGKRKRLLSHQLLPTKKALTSGVVEKIRGKDNRRMRSSDKRGLCIDNSKLAQEPISIESSSSSLSSEGVVDLTVDTHELILIDLTSSPKTNNSFRAKGTRRLESQDKEECIVISETDDDDVIVSNSPRESLQLPPLHSNEKEITCPVCMDTRDTFTKSGRSLVSTKCGHLFCDSCIRKSIGLTHKCPVCSTKLTIKQYHSIYI